MNKIITITREFGSGGRELGKRLAEKLGYKYYDKEIISQLIQQNGYSEKYFDSIDKISNDDFPYTISKSFALYSSQQKLATNMLVLEQKIIKQLASQGNCVFIGRSADLILSEYHPLNIFVYADLDSKLERCKQKAPKDENLTDKQIVQKIKLIDKARKKHSLLLGCDTWGKKEGYDFCINTSNFEIKHIVPAVELLAQTYFKEGKCQ